MPKNLIDQEVRYDDKKFKTKRKKKNIETNNEKIAKSRIKLGLLLNEFGEKNNLKVSDDEVESRNSKTNKRNAWTRKNGI